jgi:hypothetical protein
LLIRVFPFIFIVVQFFAHLFNQRTELRQKLREAQEAFRTSNEATQEVERTYEEIVTKKKSS